MRRSQISRGAFLKVLHEHGQDINAAARILQMTPDAVRARLNTLRRRGQAPDSLPKKVADAPGDTCTIGVQLLASQVAALEAQAAERRITVSELLGLLVTRHLATQAHVQRTPRQLMRVEREARSRGHVWGEEELVRRGLPLYWSEDWLRDQLARGLGPRDLFQLYGYHPRTVAQYAQQRYGIELRLTLDGKQREEMRALIASGLRRDAVAAQFGVSAVTAGKVARDLPHEKTRQVQARLQQAGPFPATTREVAQRLFAGRGNTAVVWLRAMVKAGYLQRLKRGVYVQVTLGGDPATL